MGLLKLNLNPVDIGPRIVQSARRSAKYAVDLVKHCARELSFDNAEQMAAALTYRTIFSLIPMFVLGLLVFNAFKGFEGATERLSDTFLGWSGISSIGYENVTYSSDADEARIQAHLDEFDPSFNLASDLKIGVQSVLSDALKKVSQLNFASIGIIGLVLFLYAAIGLAISMETSFNTIYSAPKGRPWHMRVTIYWAAITLGPVLLFVSLYLGGRLTDTVSKLSTTPTLKATPVGSVIAIEKDGDAVWVDVQLGKTEEVQRGMKFVVLLGEAHLGWMEVETFDPEHSKSRMRLTDGSAEEGARVVSAAGETQRPSIVVYIGAFLASMLHLVTKLTPLLASWLLLFVIYRLVPNTKVNSRAALIGSFIAALFWELGKVLFQLYVKTAVPYNAVYGSLGLVPLFLFWIYITWLIVLFGLELSYTLQVMKTGEFKYAAARSMRDTFYDTRWLIPMMGMIAREFKAGRLMTREDLARELALPIRLVVCLGDDLEKAGFIHRTESGDEEGPGYSLTKPPENIRVSELIDLSRTIANASATERRPMAERAAIPGWALLDKLNEKQRDAAGGMNLIDLLEAQKAAAV